MFYRSLFVRFSFFFWPLCCLSFFDLRIMITTFVSSNYSYKLLFDIEIVEVQIYMVLLCMINSSKYVNLLLCLSYISIDKHFHSLRKSFFNTMGFVHKCLSFRNHSRRQQHERVNILLSYFHKFCFEIILVKLNTG